MGAGCRKSVINEIPPDISKIIKTRHYSNIKEKDIDMVVDDNGLNRKILGQMIEHSSSPPQEIKEAIHGFDLLQKMTSSRESYRIIWLDLTMPIMDGWETIGFLRAPYPYGLDYKGVIIAVTAYADQDTQNECKNLGFTGFMPKPYTIKVINMICDHLT